MKIIENSANRLVLKQSATGARMAGAVLAVAGLAGTGVGASGKHTPIIIFGVVFMLFGVLMLLFTKSDVVTADKSARQLSVTFSSLKNRSGQTQQVSFDDVQQVQIFQEYQTQYNNTGTGMNNMNNNGFSIGSGINIGNNSGFNNGGTSTELVMRLKVVLKNGTMITVGEENHNVSTGLGITSSGLTTNGQQLASAIGVPFQEAGAATPGQAIQAIEQAVTGQSQSFVPNANLPTIATPPVNPVPAAAVQAPVAPPAATGVPEVPSSGPQPPAPVA